MRLRVAGDSPDKYLKVILNPKSSPKAPEGTSESQAVSGGFSHWVTMRLKSFGVSARWTYPATH